MYICKDNIETGIETEPNTLLNTLLHADVQIVTQETEDNLQRAAHSLSQNAICYKSTKFTKKAQKMAFKGRNSVGLKIIMHEEILEQVSHFSYLGCDVSFKFYIGIGK